MILAIQSQVNHLELVAVEPVRLWERVQTDSATEATYNAFRPSEVKQYPTNTFKLWLIA